MSDNESEIESKDELSIKHQAFINEYLQCFDQTKAYLKVYPDTTHDSARANSARLIANDSVKAELDRRLDQLKERVPSDIIQHLKNLVFFNISDLLDDQGNIDKVKIKNNSIPGIVSGITIQDDISDKGSRQKVSFKLTDQTKAIELMSKILKLYEDKTDINVNIPTINVKFE